MIHVKVKEKQIDNKGLGVFADEYIPAGTVIWKENNDSKRYSKEEYEKLPEDIKKHPYYDGEFYVWSQGYGESWNHSCDANTWWTADNELSARRNISLGEEITYDYATSDLDSNITYDWECKCGAQNCRHQLKWDDLLTHKKLFQEYKGHLPKWVEKYIGDRN